MSAALLTLWLKWIFGTLIALGLLYELLAWRARRMAGKWLARDFKRMHIDVPPWKDPRDSQRLDEEFRRQHPSRFA